MNVMQVSAHMLTKSPWSSLWERPCHAVPKNKNLQHSIKSTSGFSCSVERFVPRLNDAFHRELLNDDDLYVERVPFAHSEDGFMQSDAWMRQDLAQMQSWRSEFRYKSAPWNESVIESWYTHCNCFVSVIRTDSWATVPGTVSLPA